MKAHSTAIILVFIELFGLGLPCSKDDLGIIPNAFIKCPTNDSCEAKCYRGYVFTDGETTTEYSCQNGDWTPIPSACKRVPFIHIMYQAILGFPILPSKCDNISKWLNATKEMLEEEILESCISVHVPIDLTVNFTFQPLAFQVTTNFSAEYTNFTGKKSVETCSSTIVLRFKNNNYPLFNNLFRNITCQNQAVAYSVFEDLFISDQYEHCPVGMNVRNVTSTKSEETMEHYCDYEITDASPMSVTNVREQTTATSTNFQDNAALEKEQTDLKVIYIGASAGGATVPIVLVIVAVIVVCRKKKSDTSEGHLKTLEMKKYAGDETFKGELIENVFYQSADDFVNDGKNVNSLTSTEDSVVIYSTAKSTNKTETGLNCGMKNLNQGYSLKPVEETSTNGGRETKIADILKCDTPIAKDCDDSDHMHFNADEYAVINKSDKPL